MNEKNYIVFDLESQGLNPCYGDKITCICAKDNDGDIFKKAGDNEKEIILNFFNWLSSKKDYFFVTINGKDFDIPFIITRCFLNGIDFLSSEFLLKVPNFDLQQLTSKKISLSDLAILFLGTKKSNYGKYAIILATEKRYEELIKYCMEDVLLTEKIYYKIKEFKNE